MLCLDVKNNARILLLPTYYSTTEFIYYHELQYLTYQQSYINKNMEKNNSHFICNRDFFFSNPSQKSRARFHHVIIVPKFLIEKQKMNCWKKKLLPISWCIVRFKSNKNKLEFTMCVTCIYSSLHTAKLLKSIYLMIHVLCHS